MNNLIFKSPIRGYSGYSIVARNFFKEYFKLYPKNTSIEELLWVSDSSYGYNINESKEILKAKENVFRKEESIHFQITLANEFIKDNNYISSIGYSMFETTSIPSTWINKCNSMDKIIVPSKFNKNTYKNSGVNIPIEVIPLGVDSNFFNPDTKKFNSFPQTFNFLCVAQLTQRKGIDLVIKAFLELFAFNNNVSLLLRCYFDANNPNDYINTQNFVKHIRNELGINTGNIYLISEIDEYQINRLYTSSNVLISPFRGEGWCLPVSEALSCEIPVITTNFSGVTEFVDKENVLLLDYKLTNIPYGQNNNWMNIASKENHLWAEPNYEQLKEYMKEVYGYYHIYKAKAKKARNKLINNFQWKHSAEKLDKIINLN